jgi:hypothetical protein
MLINFAFSGGTYKFRFVYNSVPAINDVVGLMLLMSVFNSHCFTLDSIESITHTLRIFASQQRSLRNFVNIGEDVGIEALLAVWTQPPFITGRRNYFGDRIMLPYTQQFMHDINDDQGDEMFRSIQDYFEWVIETIFNTNLVQRLWPVLQSTIDRSRSDLTVILDYIINLTLKTIMKPFSMCTPDVPDTSCVVIDDYKPSWFFNFINYVDYRGVLLK